jgi:hypothetical protein
MLQLVNGEFRFYQASSGTAGNSISFNQNMTIDNSGNVGIGVTPEAWTVFKPLQIGQASSFVGRISVNQTDVATNWYYDGAEKRIASGFAQRYTQDSNGEHQWYTAGTDNADSAITFTQRMVIDSSGKVGIGTTNPGYTFTVNKSITNDWLALFGNTYNGAGNGVLIDAGVKY